MRLFNYNRIIESVLNKENVNLLTAIYEQKGRQESIYKFKKDTINDLSKVAYLKNIHASSVLSKEKRSEKRIKDLIDYKLIPKNKADNDAIFHSKTLNLINTNFKNIEISANNLMKIYQYLNIEGRFRSQNIESAKSRNVAPDYQNVQLYLEKICTEYNDKIASDNPPLIIIAIFLMDLLCIKPFDDKNEELARIVFQLMLYKNGFNINYFIPIEETILSNKDIFYRYFKLSSTKWLEENNDYSFFVKAVLTIVLSAYKQLNYRTLLLESKNKSDRIKNIFLINNGKITKKEIMDLCPDISMTMIELTLSNLLKDKFINKIGNGRSTSYIKS